MSTLLGYSDGKAQFDCVGFSVLLINLAKNWCVKFFFQINSGILRPGKKKSFMILNWLCFVMQSL